MKSKSMAKKLLCLLFSVIFIMSLATAAFASTDNETAEKLSPLENKTAAVVTGTPQDSIVQNYLPNAKLEYFNNLSDMCLALDTEKIDFFVVSSVNYFGIAEQYPQFGYINAPLAYFDIGAIFPKDGSKDELMGKFNEYIAQIKDSGDLEALQNKWLFSTDYEILDIPSSGENGTIKLATTNTYKPFSFMLDEKNVGFDIAVIAGFAKEYGYGVKIENTDFSGIISGISTEKYDMGIGQISYTAERAESVKYSDFYYTQEIVPIVKASKIDSPYLVTSDSVTDGTSKNGVMANIKKTLIDQNRWQSILKGLAVTMLITVLGFILANLLGALFCAMAMSKSKALRFIADIYSKLMQGLPIIVILMILYYIVFAHSEISNVTVAIIGFGMVFGAYLAQLFEGGIGGIDKGQWEASLAIGFTKRQTFRGIILPQAIRTMLPGYFSNFISLMKGTAVVGYIAVTDLTKVGDIIRSNTYEAIVPLISIAIIYFAIACILLTVMKAIRKKLSPRRIKKSDLNLTAGGADL